MPGMLDEAGFGWFCVVRASRGEIYDGLLHLF